MSQPLSNFKFYIYLILSWDYFNRKLLQLSNYVKSVFNFLFGGSCSFFHCRGHGMWDGTLNIRTEEVD
jgi:hypothetical protein